MGLLLRPTGTELTADNPGLVAGMSDWRWPALASCMTATCSDVFPAPLSAAGVLVTALVMLRPAGTAMILSFDTAASLGGSEASAGALLRCAATVAAPSSFVDFSLCWTGITVKPRFCWSFCKMLCGLDRGAGEEGEVEGPPDVLPPASVVVAVEDGVEVEDAGKTLTGKTVTVAGSVETLTLLLVVATGTSEMCRLSDTEDADDAGNSGDAVTPDGMLAEVTVAAFGGCACLASKGTMLPLLSAGRATFEGVKLLSVICFSSFKSFETLGSLPWLCAAWLLGTSLGSVAGAAAFLGLICCTGTWHTRGCRGGLSCWGLPLLWRTAATAAGLPLACTLDVPSDALLSRTGDTPGAAASWYPENGRSLLLATAIRCLQDILARLGGMLHAGCGFVATLWVSRVARSLLPLVSRASRC